MRCDIYPAMTDNPGSASPTVARGILLMFLSSLSYAVSFSTVRALSDDFSVFQLVLFRTAIGTSVMLPWLFRSGLGVLRTSRWRLYGLRALLVYAGNLSWFYALARLNLAEATALSFLMPVFAAIILALWLHEKLGRHRLIALGLGFLGALVIIRPGWAPVGTGVYAVLVMVVFYAGATSVIRALTLTEDANAVVFYMFALNLPLALGPGIAHWNTPALAHLPIILLFGAASWFAQFFMTRALASAEAAVVMPAFYLQLPITAALGFFLFGQVPDAWVIPGALLIIGGSYYSVWSEKRSQATRAA